ncbi:MAG TPA: response regulator [Candidatus Binatia bacterium]|jgi:CheY-like chemotaxis protein|nr:response regulator [Candidatus Binatia bacterium]
MSAARRRVLVVDDNPGYLDVIRTILGDADHGIDVEVAETGTAAIGLLRDRPPDALPAVVFLDFHLPDLTAPEVLRRLRALPTLHDVRVVVMSQSEWDADRRAALDAGAQDFFAKPSRAQALRDLLLSHLPPA